MIGSSRDDFGHPEECPERLSSPYWHDLTAACKHKPERAKVRVSGETGEEIPLEISFGDHQSFFNDLVMISRLVT